MVIDDEEIIKNVQKGNLEQFGKLVNKYDKKLFGYINKITNQNNEQIEDLLSEVFIKAYENIQSFNNKKKFINWLYRIAHNTCIDFFRRNKIATVTLNPDDDFYPSKDLLIEDAEIKKERLEEINGAISRLEVKYREVIILYFIEEKNYDEISEILRISTSAVGVLLFRAKQKLKKMLTSKNEK